MISDILQTKILTFIHRPFYATYPGPECRSKGLHPIPGLRLPQTAQDSQQ